MSLESLFNPKSVAIIGASNTPGKVGYAIVKNLIDADFEGKIYPELKEIEMNPTIVNETGAYAIDAIMIK